MKIRVIKKMMESLKSKILKFGVIGTVITLFLFLFSGIIIIVSLLNNSVIKDIAGSL